MAMLTASFKFWPQATGNLSQAAGSGGGTPSRINSRSCGPPRREQQNSSPVMLISIPDVLTAEQVALARRILEAAERVAGRVTADHPDHPSVVQTTNVYHNLLRQWAEM
jgi:hypothetical protein